MRKIWLGTVAAVLCLGPAAWADTPGPQGKAVEVPYRLTIPKHILVRAKINGKGPFNFILDTGAPALFVSTKVCDKLGIKRDKNGWGTFARFEIEGGVVVKEARGRIEDPFQLEGMNGLGLAGAELHGVIGYNILARYRMEIDFTRDKMVWTALDFKPADPKGLGGKGGAGGLEVVGSMMKMMGSFLGLKATPDIALRGFLGIELIESPDAIMVTGVLDKGPASESGLKKGDLLVKLQGRGVYSLDDVRYHALKLRSGEKVTLTIKRGTETKEITFKSGEGL